MPLRNAVFAAQLLLVWAAAASGQTAAVAARTPPLTALNDAFRAAYADAKTRELAISGPVLIANGDQFTLMRKGIRTEANVGVPVYDAIKTISHTPLAVYVVLTPGEGTIDDKRLNTLAELRKLIAPAQASLDSLKLPAATLARQKRIVEASLAFLDEATERRTFERSSLLAFARSMTPLVFENVTEAARAQLDAIHTQVSAWRSQFSPQEWRELRVLVIGPHMPREDLVVMQYFLRLLHEPREGVRVVYAESLWDEPKALDLLATHMLDGSVSEAFFGDPLRMHRDLLGEAAKRYVSRLLPE